MPHPTPVRLEYEGDVLVIVIDHPPVNAASQAVRAGLLQALQHLSDTPALRAGVLMGAGRTFVAGSDLREFGQALAPPELPQVIEAIEACGKPVVAALHGAVLGGGLELALGCDARLAAPGTVLGLPEVTLGMVPGAGGTQRLPRLVGVSQALRWICSGTRVEDRLARDSGLIDAIVDSSVRAAAVAEARKRIGTKQRVSDQRPPHEPAEVIERAAADAWRRGRGRAPVASAIDLVRAAATEPIDQALQRERASFQAQRVAPEAFARRHLFFAERTASRLPSIDGVAARPFNTVAVIGAGLMGTGIAACLLEAGLPVILHERDERALALGVERLGPSYSRQLTATTDVTALQQADIVIEAVFEDLDVKREVFNQIGRWARPGAVLASNTSYLDLDEIAAASGRPADVIGLHFFSPAQRMTLLEIVQGAASASDALATAAALARRLRKQSVFARNAFGFIGNRIYAAYRRQCEFLVEEGAWPEQVDATLERFGMSMGPFAVADLSGLDIAWRMRQAQAAQRDPEHRYVSIADRLCEAGRLGRKTGRGYYRYDGASSRGVPDPEVHALIAACVPRPGAQRRVINDDEIVERAVLSMVNEAALLLCEGVAQRADDVDVVMTHGYGFPRWEGGPVYWARQQDPQALEARLDWLAAVSGPGWKRGNVRSLASGLEQDHNTP